MDDVPASFTLVDAPALTIDDPGDGPDREVP